LTFIGVDIDHDNGSEQSLEGMTTNDDTTHPESNLAVPSNMHTNDDTAEPESDMKAPISERNPNAGLKKVVRKRKKQRHTMHSSKARDAGENLSPNVRSMANQCN
jgi:hypothetical protein